MKKENSKTLTPAQKAELDALAAMPDDQINTADVPEQRDWSGARRGFFSAHKVASITADPVLVRYRQALSDVYGDRLERVILYGSRARGDARPDSDYDVAVFLHDMKDLGSELHRLANLEVVIIDETGEVVHAMPYRAGAYNERTPLMREIRREGVEL